MEPRQSGRPDRRSPASPAWLRRQAARSLALGNVALAIEQLMSVRATGRLPWTDTMTLLAAMARAGRWSEAGAEVRAMNTAREGAPELAFVETVARLRAGDRTAAQTVCRDLITRHGTTRNPDRALWTLRACLLDREAATQPGWSAVASLLDALVDQRTYGTRDSLAGAIAVRSRRHAEAIAMLQRAAQAGEATPHTALFLGLALAQSNRRAEAQRWLVESERFSWPPTTMFSQRTFRDAWFEGEAVILREELRAILR